MGRSSPVRRESRGRKGGHWCNECKKAVRDWNGHQQRHHRTKYECYQCNVCMFAACTRDTGIFKGHLYEHIKGGDMSPWSATAIGRFRTPVPSGFRSLMTCSREEGCRFSCLEKEELDWHTHKKHSRRSRAPVAAELRHFRSSRNATVNGGRPRASGSSRQHGPEATGGHAPEVKRLRTPVAAEPRHFGSSRNATVNGGSPRASGSGRQHGPEATGGHAPEVERQRTPPLSGLQLRWMKETTRGASAPPEPMEVEESDRPMWSDCQRWPDNGPVNQASVEPCGAPASRPWLGTGEIGPVQPAVQGQGPSNGWGAWWGPPMWGQGQGQWAFIPWMMPGQPDGNSVVPQAGENENPLARSGDNTDPGPEVPEVPSSRGKGEAMTGPLSLEPDSKEEAANHDGPPTASATGVAVLTSTKSEEDASASSTGPSVSGCGENRL